MSDILDDAFPDPSLELDTTLVDDEVAKHIPLHGEHNYLGERTEEQERLRIEAFGGRVAMEAEYDGRAQIRHFNRNRWRR